MFVDTHAHLSDPAFDADRDEVLEAAFESGVPFLVEVGCDPDGSAAAVAMAERHPRVYAACGVHPHQAKDHGVEGARALAARFGDHPRVVALGEMGLDYHYDYSPRELQREVFRAQLDEAAARRLPVVVHVREAEEDALASMEEAGWPAGIWHCFTGSMEAAQRAVEAGMYVSFSGILTFPSAEALRQVAAALPEERLLCETDCPYLAPVPKRGKRNQPAWVHHTGRALAAVRGRSPEEMAGILEQNARRVFSLESE